MESLRQLAQILDVPERTLRRAAAEGLVRGERVSERRFRTSLREEDYLRRHWPLLSTLRSVLRTEPSVRLALLFGSVARGDDHARSDIDIAVALQKGSVGHVADVARRLSDRLERDVQLVRIEDARASATLMPAILEHGRVLIDRDHLWPTIRRSALASPATASADLLDDLPEVS